MERETENLHYFIEVSDLSVKDSHISKHVIYKITGNDYNGYFECSRRYKEFDQIRKVLVKKWPGCCIPSIPPKQLIGNLDANFVEIRMKLLNDFLKKIMQIPYLYNSEDFQSFIRLPTDFMKLSSEEKKSSYPEIAEKFKETFSEFLCTHSAEHQEKYIQETLTKLIHAYPILEGFEKTCQGAFESFQNFEIEMNNLMNGLNEITEFYSQSYGFNFRSMALRGAFKNPYSVLLDWARTQLLDVQAFIEALDKRNILEHTKAKLSEKYESEFENLEALKKGKKKLSQLFSIKSKEEKLQEQEKIVLEAEAEMKAVNTICHINSERIINNDLPEFKKINMEKTELVMKCFINANSREIDEVIYQFAPLYDIYNEIFR